MANSLSIQGQVVFQAPAGSQTVNEFFNLAASTTPAGTTLNKQVFSATSSPASVTFSGVTTLGVIFLRNLDSTNTVTYGINSAGQSGSLQPGEVGIWRPNGNTMFAGTTSGVASLQIFATPN